MGGRTGKMTAEELDARGPRLVLAIVKLPRQKGWRPAVGKFIFREEEDAVRWSTPYAVISKSYSLRYLLNVAKSN